MMISGLSNSATDFLRPYLNGTGQEPFAARKAREEGVPQEAAGVQDAQDSGRVKGEASETPPVSAGNEPKNAKGEALSEEEMHRITELAQTDRHVRQHEQAHMAAGGSMVTSGPSYEYETGPDGKRYAVAGEVGISVSKGRTPEETLQRARQVRAAALAPADPSTQDRQVAAMASQMEMEAMQEIARQRQAESQGGDDDRPKPVQADGAGKPGKPDLPTQSEGIQSYRQMSESIGNPSASNDSRRVSVFA